MLFSHKELMTRLIKRAVDAGMLRPYHEATQREFMKNARYRPKFYLMTYFRWPVSPGFRW